MYSGAIGELMCLRTKESRDMAMRTTWRPMRPKPLTPSLMAASGLADMVIGAARPMEAEASESMIEQMTASESEQRHVRGGAGGGAGGGEGRKRGAIERGAWAGV